MIEITLSILTGLLFAAALYLLLHRSFIKLIIGIITFANACNLFLLVAGRLNRHAPAFIHERGKVAIEEVADPLPQAMILTAIVIGLGVQAFSIVLLKRIYYTSKTSDMDELTETDSIEHA